MYKVVYKVVLNEVLHAMLLEATVLYHTFISGPHQTYALSQSQWLRECHLKLVYP